MPRATSITTTASYGVASVTTISSMLDSFTSEEWAAIGVCAGIVFGFLTWLTNVYFQSRRLKLMEKKLADNEQFRPPPGGFTGNEDAL